MKLKCTNELPDRICLTLEKRFQFERFLCIILCESLHNPSREKYITNKGLIL